MLIIRNDQMRVLSTISSRPILLEHARKFHGATVQSLGNDGLDHAVMFVLDLSCRLRLDNTGDRCRMLDLAMVFGTDWQRPESRWLHDGMFDSKAGEPALRLRKVWRRALRKLAGQA